MYEKDILKLNDELVLNDKNEIENINDVFLFEKKEQSAVKSCKLISYLQYENDNIDKEIERLQALKTRNDKKIQSVKNYVYYCSKELGTKSFGNYTVQTRTTKAVEVDSVDIEKVPSEFVNVREVKTISKTKIKEYLEQPVFINQETGEMVENQLPWARIVENKSIVIK